MFLCATFVNCSNSSDEDENEVSDTEDIIENNDLPEHEFVTEEKTVKSGKNKVQVQPPISRKSLQKLSIMK